MNKILDIIVWSSANPEKTSMTVKGILIQYSAFLLVLASVMNIPLTETRLYQIITDASFYFGLLLTLVGLLRKVYFALKKPEDLPKGE